MIRVLHFVHRVPPDYSGAAYQALHLIEALGKVEGRVIENHLVAYARDPGRALPPAGIPASIVRLRRGPLGKLRQYRELRAVYQRTRADIVHVHGYHRPAVLFAGACPTVLKTTMLEVDDVPSIRARGPLDARLVERVQRVVSMTPAIAQANAGVPTTILPNGVDLQVFRPRGEDPEQGLALRRTLGIEDHEQLFLFAGGDSPRKGFRQLPDLWRRIRDRVGPHARLLVAGRFQDADNAAWFQAEAGPGAVLHPELLDLGKWLPATDVFLFLSEREGLPNVVLEAAATDTFVLARDLPGTFDGILDESNAVVAPELDDDVLARLAKRLADGDHQRVDNTGFRERFSLDHVARCYQGLYAQLCEERPGKQVA